MFYHRDELNVLSRNRKQVLFYSHKLRISEEMVIFAISISKTNKMKTREEYISLIKDHTDEIKHQFGLKSLFLFGSVSRNEQTEESDVDVCVDMEPKMYLVVRLKRFLEHLLQCPVDVIRMHKHMNTFLKEEIEHDGICIIK